MAEDHDPIAALFTHSHAYFQQEIMDMIGRQYIADSANINTSPEEIARLRRDIFVPILNGAMQAAWDVTWVTAPPNATREDADLHAGLLLAQLMDRAGGGRPLGHFWMFMAAEEMPAGHA